MTKKYDVESLTEGEMRTILLRYEGLFEAQTAANNTLISKLVSEGVSDKQALILNNWSIFHNCLFDNLALEIEKALSGPIN